MPTAATMTLEIHRAETLLERIRSVHVLVVGDLMLDVYLRGNASRISPEAPVPVVRVDDEWRALGGAGNVAANVAALGARTTLVGLTGHDATATTFDELCRDLGIDPAGVIHAAGRATTVKTRVLVGYQQVARYDREADTDVDAAEARALQARIEAAAHDADAIVLADYDKGVLVPAVIRAALDAAGDRQIPVVVDPKARRFSGYAGCTVFKPNLAELADGLRDAVLPDDPEWMESARRQLRCDHLLLTLGPDGMALTPDDQGGLRRIPAIARSVYDVSGAGDTVAALVAATLAAGGSVLESAILATHAAGVEVGKAGVATVAPAEVLASLDELARAAPGAAPA